MLRTREAHQHDFAHNGGDRSKNGRRDFWRESGPGQLEFFTHHLPGLIQIRTPDKFDPHHGNAGRGRRADTPHTCRPIHRRFEGKRDEHLHFFRRHSMRLGQDGDRWRGQVREDIDWHADGDQCAAE